jgi:hypothetical protein
VDAEFTRARSLGEDGRAAHRRSWLDWTIVVVASGILVAFASVARAPQIQAHWGWAAALAFVMLAIVSAVGTALWRTTRFS